MVGEEREARPFLTKADLKREFELTDAHLALLGEPDDRLPDPDHPGQAPSPVYARSRVKQWVAENQTLLEEARAKRQALDARRARERAEEAVEREESKRTVAAAVKQWKLRTVPNTTELVENARASLRQEYGGASADANERAILAYILDKFTDYSRILRMLTRLDAGFELSAAARIYVCCQVIREYGLVLDPVEAALGPSAAAMVAPTYKGEDPEAVAIRILGL